MNYYFSGTNISSTSDLIFEILLSISFIDFSIELILSSIAVTSSFKDVISPLLEYIISD